MNYQQPPDHEAGTAAGQSPGGYQDERAQNRRYGAQQGGQAQPPPGWQDPQFRYPTRQPYRQPPPQNRYGQPDPGQWQERPPRPDQAWRGYAYQRQPSYPPQPYRDTYQPAQPYGWQSSSGPEWPRKSWPRRHMVLTALGAVAGVFLTTLVIGAAARPGSSPQSSASTPLGAAAASPAAASSAAAAKPRTVATFTGSGIRNTPQFTVTSTWKLVYSFSCAGFGQSGNFQVFEDGGQDFSGVSVNDLAMRKSSSTWGYNDAGTHYLQINSECAWKVKVVDEP